MVCAKCEKKTSRLAAPDPTVASSSSNRKIGENKLLSSKRFSPYSTYSNKCKDCKSSVAQNMAIYCQNCAYKKGLCAICGKMVLDVKKGGYKQSSK
ncbi:Microtubule-associated protein CRIPT [Phaffia rhodozyma]|uniref:Cysteine-rich PDZ-binding protein n=1 Tax=Phaffia rhodozyma TaxID=264483 RepID=A0A0F7SUB0_PHARH|nr:Microtubule-associated protein CRIPT [Phaffia rhodozyma]